MSMKTFLDPHQGYGLADRARASHKYDWSLCALWNEKKQNNKNLLFFQDMFQGTGKLLVKAYVQMPMDVRGPPGQFQNLFNWFLVPCLHLPPSSKSTFRRIVLGGNSEGIKALCDQDPSCKAFAFSAEENAVEMRYAIRDQKSFC